MNETIENIEQFMEWLFCEPNEQLIGYHDNKVRRHSLRLQVHIFAEYLFKHIVYDMMVRQVEYETKGLMAPCHNAATTW